MVEAVMSEDTSTGGDSSPTVETQYAASLSSVQEAQERIRPFVHVTPVLTSSSLDEQSGKKLYFKCELFQKGGAFKFRGASNAILSLSDQSASKGVVTHSSGNHAAAMALAAQSRGIPAYVVMPKNAPKCKVENVKRYGGNIIFCEPTIEAREETARNVEQQRGSVMVHPFNDERVISGQGTIALEFLQQVPQLDAIIVPISGGGLISGIALAAKAIKPCIRIFAAEPKGADDAARSKEAGRLVTLLQTSTIADGLRAFLGSLTWPVVRDMVDEVITVEEEEIITSMKLFYKILKIAVEPSGAVGLAAVLSHQFGTRQNTVCCEHVGIVVSGGNVDLDLLCDLLKDIK